VIYYPLVVYHPYESRVMVLMCSHSDSEDRTKFGVRTETGMEEQMVWNILYSLLT